MIIGVDLGNYSVKTSKGINFLSKVNESNGLFDEKVVVFDNKKLLIGEGEFETDFNKSMKKNTLPLLYTALALSDDEEECFDVVLGLPIQQYKANKDEVIKYINDNNNKLIEVNGVAREIYINDVQVVPEGASAYYNLSYENKQLIGNKQLVIVDIGGRTTDVCLFKDKKIKNYKTIPDGMLNIYNDIVTVVNELYSQNFVLEDGEEVLKEGLFLDGEEKDLMFVKQILKKHFDTIFKELQLNFNVAKGYVLLTGGGAGVFKTAFKNRLKNLIVSEDNVFDNVKGFKKVGDSLWQQREV